jgi:hypothetical protein
MLVDGSCPCVGLSGGEFIFEGSRKIKKIILNCVAGLRG